METLNTISELKATSKTAKYKTVTVLLCSVYHIKIHFFDEKMLDCKCNIIEPASTASRSEEERIIQRYCHL